MPTPRWILILSLSLLTANSLRAAASDVRLLLTAAEAETIRAAVHRPDASIRPLVLAARKKAEESLRQGPWSVTFHRPRGLDLPPNDFFSQAPYWGADPKNPNGAYIRRDGERNPDRFTTHEQDLRSMTYATLALAMGARFLEEPRYAQQAAKALRTWFVDRKTRMNPRMEHAEAIRGVNSGRAAGIMDTSHLIWVVQAALLLEDTPSWDPDLSKELRSWFSEYVQWLTTHEMGLHEKNTPNNHSTWYTVQVAVYALFTGRSDLQEMAWRHCREVLVPRQIRRGGDCPAEEERTQSLSYSSMNLNAFALLGRLAGLQGIDLWNIENTAGGSIVKAMDYLAPFVRRPELWKKPQIRPFDKGKAYFPALAGLSLNQADYLRLFDELAGNVDEPELLFLRLLTLTHPR